MKLILKKWISLVLALYMVLMHLPAPTVRAAEVPITLEKIQMESTAHSASMISDWTIENDKKLTQHQVMMPFGENEYMTDPTEAGERLRDAIKNREETLSIFFEADADVPFEDIVSSIHEVAVAHTGEPDEGDYLAFQRPTIGSEGSCYPGGETKQYSVVFHIRPYTTLDQEAQVDAAVTQLLEDLRLDGKSDYEKISTVYRWMCAHIAYDYEHCESWDYTLRHTAYAALIDRTADSQGYAVLFYRLMLELGIDCRVVTTYGGDDSHAWNIVKLGGMYYNVDAACDAPIYAEEGTMHYFLRGDYVIEDHYKHGKFRTEEFSAQYPMSEADYVPSQPECSHVFDQWCGTDQYSHQSVCNICGYVECAPIPAPCAREQKLSRCLRCL